jgi:methylmalonyl-CoA mutase C-terminal domain/subunit
VKPLHRRVVLAKLGLDGHDVGVNLVARALRDAGIEVIYLGKRVSSAQIVATAISEDADAIGLSCLSGGLGYFAAKTAEELVAHHVAIPILAGGIDEPAEIQRMLDAGVRCHFGPGTDMPQIVEAFQRAMSEEPVDDEVKRDDREG